MSWFKRDITKPIPPPPALPKPYPRVTRSVRTEHEITVEIGEGTGYAGSQYLKLTRQGKQAQVYLRVGYMNGALLTTNAKTLRTIAITCTEMADALDTE